MTIIKNRAVLVSHGNVAGRQVALDILEAGLRAGDPLANTVACLRIEAGKLIVGNDRFPRLGLSGSTWLDRPRPWPDEPLVFDLDKINHIYVVGGGKAAQRIAEGIEHVLGDRITEGHVCAKKGDTVRLERIGVTLAGHPIPDEDSVAGARRILEIERKARSGDIVFMAMSGGGTALMACPAPGLTLSDLQAVDRILYFQHGAEIVDANRVRGLLSVLRLKHSRYVGDAAFLQFTCNERPPTLMPKGHSLPPFGRTDFEQAIHILHAYDCWDEIPEAVRRHLLRGDPQHQLLRGEEWWDRPHFNFRIMGPEFMLSSAMDRAHERGLDAHILASSLNGQDARAVGETVGYVAREIAERGQPSAAPCVYLLGGELAVSTGREHGVGGRNQEFALAAALRIAGLEHVVIVSADSDGRDGPSEFAGAIVDGRTLARAAELDIDVLDVLHRHDTEPAFRTLGDGLDTGIQHTNIQDLRVVYVDAPQAQRS